MRKNCTFILLLLSITLLTSSTTFAQAKIAYVNMQQLITSMPEAQQAYDSLQQYQQLLLKDGQALVSAYQAMLNDLNSTQVMTAAIRETKQKELELAQSNINKYNDRMTQQLQIREEELTAPILAKVKKAVAAIAAEKGVVCVLDNSKDIVVTATCEDLLPAAKLKLGIK